VNYGALATRKRIVMFSLQTFSTYSLAMCGLWESHRGFVSSQSCNLRLSHARLVDTGTRLRQFHFHICIFTLMLFCIGKVKQVWKLWIRMASNWLDNSGGISCKITSALLLVSVNNCIERGNFLFKLERGNPGKRSVDRSRQSVRDEAQTQRLQ